MVKISNLEIENVKRVRAVALEPAENGLTVIGGRNGQGKTSVLDAITWALAGDRFRPSQAQRMGSVLPPNIRIELSNGIVVERKGKNSSLKVISPDGSLGGQKLLDGFISTFALDVPRFMIASGKEKAKIMLDALGLRDEVIRLSDEENRIYNERHALGVIYDRKRKFVQEQPYYPDAPTEPVSMSELLARHQRILAINGENQRKREQLHRITAEKHRLFDSLRLLDEQIEEMKAKREQMLNEYNKAAEDETAGYKTVAELHDESTAEIEENIANIESINRQVRANLDKAKAEADAEEYKMQYSELTASLDEVRKKKTELLNGTNTLLSGLSVEDGELMMNGCKWDCMSASEQLRAATAIVRRLNPECGFVLMDKLEQLDIDTLNEFGNWLEEQGLQMIATRVSTGDECSLIIEDGLVRTEGVVPEFTAKKWTKGEF